MAEQVLGLVAELLVEVAAPGEYDDHPDGAVFICDGDLEVVVHPERVADLHTALDQAMNILERLTRSRAAAS